MAAVKAALTSLASAPGAAVEGLASLALGDPLNWEENDHSPPEAFQRQVSEAEDLDQTEAGGEDRRELKQRSGGAVFHFTIVADDFADPKLTVNGGAELKPRQALPAMRASDFFGKLRRHPSGNGGFVLPGNPAGVNGWPSLTFDLEVLAVTARVAGLKSLVGAATIKRCWERPKDKAVKATTANSGGKGSEDKARSGSGDGGDDGGGGGVGSAPSFPKGASTCRVTLLAPAWTMRGYTEQSPGFVFWATTHTTPAGLPVAGSAAASDAAAADAAVAAATAGGGGALLSPALAAAFPRLAALPGSGAVARVAFGEDLVALAANGTLYGPTRRAVPELTKCSIFAHRYAMRRESAKDFFTYHSGCFLEWDHGQFGTIVELAWLYGVGGYKGKVNWHPDKDAKGPGGTSLFRAMPGPLVAPWDNHRSELRVYDVPMRDAADLAEYMKRYSGPSERFFVPDIVETAPVRLAHRSQAHLARYLINYVGNDPSYHEESRNCQTFTADLFGFLTGKRDVRPYHQFNRLLYKPRHWQFLYEPKSADGQVADGDGRR